MLWSRSARRSKPKASRCCATRRSHLPRLLWPKRPHRTRLSSARLAVRQGSGRAQRATSHPPFERGGGSGCGRSRIRSSLRPRSASCRSACPWPAGDLACLSTGAAACGRSQAGRMRGAALSPSRREAVLRDVMALFDTPALSALFGPRSRAEAPVAGHLPLGPPARCARIRPDRSPRRHGRGGVDRRLQDRRGPARRSAGRARHLCRAARRLPGAGARLYPGLPVRCLLVWTSGPVLAEIPAARLDAALAAIAASAVDSAARFDYPGRIGLSPLRDVDLTLKGGVHSFNPTNPASRMSARPAHSSS